MVVVLRLPAAASAALAALVMTAATSPVSAARTGFGRPTARAPTAPAPSTSGVVAGTGGQGRGGRGGRGGARPRRRPAKSGASARGSATTPSAPEAMRFGDVSIPLMTAEEAAELTIPFEEVDSRLHDTLGTHGVAIVTGVTWGSGVGQSHLRSERMSLPS